MKKLKPLLCFDLDGTILDSNEAHIKAYNEAFKKNQLETFSSEKLISVFGLGGEKIIQVLFPKISDRKLIAVRKDHSKLILKHANLLKPFPGVVEALQELRKHFTLAILSNNRHEDIMELLESAKVSTRNFHMVIGADDVSHAKPAPDELFKAEKLAHEKADYMIGDTIYDVRSGKKASVKTIAVLTGADRIPELLKEDPDLIVKGVAHLPVILLEE